MLRWILAFLIMTITAAVFGFSEVAVRVADLSRAFFYIFITLLLVTVVFGDAVGRPAAPRKTSRVQGSDRPISDRQRG
ncbi:MAG: DUF1328 domain-containing protein [Flavobacteriales bacterium]